MRVLKVRHSRLEGVRAVIVRLKILLVAASVAIAGGVPCVAGAKTVKTDTITVTPGQTPGGSSIPEGDVPSVMPSTPDDAEPAAEGGAPDPKKQRVS